MPQIISTPTEEENVSHSNKEYQFGCFEKINYPIRDSQQDAITWQTLESNELTPAGEANQLTPIEIGHRLWTTYQVLDKDFGNSGTTASTTVYDGRGNLITATLADAAAFTAVYDKQGNVLGVVRLNSITHKPTDSKEAERIKQAGGFVVYGRVNGALAVSRAIGDFELKKAGVCSEATIDITNIQQIAEQLKIKPELIGKIQVISTCDGFTDGAAEQTKKGHENYLLETLKQIKSPGSKSEDELAQLLVYAAKKDGSRDNISVAIQSITQETPAFLLGVYDGHGNTAAASIYVAKNIGEIFTNHCKLTRNTYVQHNLAVNKKEEVYKRDNPSSFEIESVRVLNNLYKKYLPSLKQAEKEQAKEYSEIGAELRKLTIEYQLGLTKNNPVTKQIKPILHQLIKILDNEAVSDENKIKEFYKHLDSKALMDTTQSLNKNIDVIKHDKSVSAGNFLAGIAIILVTIATGIIPGLVISGIVYAMTGRSPVDLFNSKSEQYEKELNLVKQNHNLKNTFFEPPRAEQPESKENNQPKLEI